VGPTPTRSLRLPQVVWDALDQEAREKRTTVHALLRELVVDHLRARGK
jgi:predicted DNA-binding ribbon-helix-helix protein